MGWVILIIVGIAFVITLIETVPPQFWLVLLAIAAVIVFLCIKRKKNKREREINDPKFQELFQKAKKLKEICEGMQDRIGKPHIEEYDFFEYKPIDTYGSNNKKPFTQEDAQQSRIGHVFYQVLIKDDISLVRLRLDRYLEAHRQMMRNDNSATRAHRDNCGEQLLGHLFASKSNAKEFLRLTGYDMVDVAFDCIDLDPEDKEYVIFHFKLYCDGIYDKEKIRLLLEEIHALDNPKKQAKRRKTAKKEHLIAIPTYGQGNVQIYQCPCGTKFRVPTDKGRIVAKCPNPQCPRKWTIN